MNPARWQQIKSAFGEVLQLEPAQRSAYIEAIGATDPDLRERVASLLFEHEKDSGEFLRNPAVGLEIYRDLVDSDADTWLGKHIGPYRLVQELGSGGMGEVYLAERVEAEFDQRVAIKLIRSGEASKAVVSRFKSERQILAGLDHPNIAKLLDGGRTPQGQPYFVMEYVPGKPITHYCEDRQLDVPNRLAVLIQVCDGVQYAHQNAIIHRDLKPSNILVVEVDGKPVPRIIDFGLAKTNAATQADQTQLTQFGVFMGTPGYMSPEQADLRVRNVDTRTDVYSLGAILYALLTGLQPFETAERRLPPFDEWLRRLREEEPPAPSVKLARRQGVIGRLRGRGTDSAPRDSRVSGDLDRITMKALERDRERRYATPVELAADLRRYLRHEPIVARPPSAAYQIRLYVRRHRVAAAALAAVVFALSTGVALALWQAQVASAAAREARTQEFAARAQAAKARRMSALSAEQAGDAASQLGLASAAVARLAYAVRLDPENPELRSHLLQLLDEQDMWWLPRGPSFHHSKIINVNISRDGRRIVTGSEDGSVRIWGVDTGEQVGAVIQHQGMILSLCFSPDGKQVLTGSADHTARVWDADTGEPRGPMLTHAGAVNDAEFSHDGDRVVTASEDHTARIWDWRSGRLQGTPMQHQAVVYSIAFSPDDSRIVTSSADHTARLWDGRTGRPRSPRLRHGDSVVYAQFSSDGNRVVTASKDKTARLWDVRTGRPMGEPMRHTWVVKYAQFSPDGTRVVTHSWDRTAHIWDARTGKSLSDPMTLALQAVAISFSGDGRLVFTELQDGTVRAWDSQSGRARGALVRLTNSDIADAAFSTDGNLLVTAASDGTVHVWERRMSAKWLNPLRQDDGFRFMYFSPDGRRVVANSSGHTATIWDSQSGRPVLPPLRHDSDVLSARFSADGAKMWTLSRDYTVRIWNAITGTSLGVPLLHARDVHDVEFSPDGTLVLTALVDGTVRLWDTLTGQPHGAPLQVGEPTGQFQSADFSPDGTRVAAATNDMTSAVGVLRLWDARTGTPIGLPMRHATKVNDWSFSPDGTRIATVSAGAVSTVQHARTIRLWNAQTGAPLSEPITSAAELSPPVRFSPDGANLLTASSDGTARLWDAYSGKPFGRPMGHEAGVFEARFSTDGTRIVTAGVDQTARVWDARTGAPIGAPLHHDGVVWNARFSTDGKRIATASGDHTAQVWDAETHLPLTGPMRHAWPVRFAVLSQDGTHVLTISVGRDKWRLWPVLSATQAEAVRLADFAEAIGGYRIDADNALVPVEDRLRALNALRSEFGPHGGVQSDLDRIFDDLVGTPADTAR